VFARFLSAGDSWRDCGRPCERAALALRDGAGADHLVLADEGCRNTVFNAAAQSGARARAHPGPAPRVAGCPAARRATGAWVRRASAGRASRPGPRGAPRAGFSALCMDMAGPAHGRPAHRLGRGRLSLKLCTVCEAAGA